MKKEKSFFHFVFVCFSELSPSSGLDHAGDLDIYIRATLPGGRGLSRKTQSLTFCQRIELNP